MVQSVELILDADSEERLLHEWRVLDAAGLPSQSRHTSASNRPHVTLVAVAHLEPAVEDRIAAVCRGSLPARARIGPLTLFGRGPYVLVRGVVASPGLRSLQAEVAAATDVPDDALTSPERWVPHVTLAHRMSAEQVATALPLLSSGGEAYPVDGVQVRRWDGDARREWVVANGS